MRSNPPNFSHAQLLRALTYNASTGIFTWRVHVANLRAGTQAGHINKHGYRLMSLFKEQVYAAPLAWFYVTGRWPDQEIDHKDLNKANDAFSNLRLATRSQNCANKALTKKSRTGVKGVYKLGNSFVAHIKARGKLIHIGCFKTIEEAATAYKIEAVRRFGEFTRA